MRDSDDIGALSSDDLWALHETVVELLVGRITERSQELDALLSQLGDRTQPHQQLGHRGSAALSKAATASF